MTSRFASYRVPRRIVGVRRTAGIRIPFVGRARLHHYDRKCARAGRSLLVSNARRRAYQQQYTGGGRKSICGLRGGHPGERSDVLIANVFIADEYTANGCIAVRITHQESNLAMIFLFAARKCVLLQLGPVAPT